MAEGWIKLHRKLLGSSVFANEKLLKVWIWCLLKATHKIHKQRIGVQEAILFPGEFVFGRKVASEELNLSESTVYRYLKLLESEQKISLKVNNKWTVVTLVNWDLYQGDDSESEQQMNNKWTDDEQQMNTNKNVKNVENVKEDINNPPDSEQELFFYWNQKGIVKHPRLTPHIKISVDRALRMHPIENIKAAIDHYTEMYQDPTYAYCEYKWTLEKFLDDAKGVIFFMDDGQKWINYQDHKKKIQATIKKKDFDPYEIKRSWE